MREDIAAALAAIEGEGTFAVEQACPSEDLRLEVEGAGPVPFPIRAATARALIALAQPAPFGRRDRTLHDKSVRDTWEISGRRIKVGGRKWTHVLARQLEQIRKALGLPEGSELTAELDKMLVYEPGQFFAPHQDSERDDTMVGSLVVELPSRRSGGAIVVEHLGDSRIFRGAPRGPTDLSLLAFYADCRHEVQPIDSGFRVVLTYHLLHRRPAGSSPPVPPTAAVDRLAERVEAYFKTPVAGRYSQSPPERPDRLVYLLDHEYTERSLGWDRLKNADRVRAEALREVAKRLGCEIFLALADVHEHWACEEEYGWDRRRRRYHEDEEDDETRTAEGHTLIELIDSDMELRCWIDRSGKALQAVPAIPGEGEVCFTRSSGQMTPFRYEHEGYTGNAGNTVDRWYHRAAVVLWPMERDFVVRAQVSPAWAIKELGSLLRVGAAGDALAKARQLTSWWGRGAAQEQGAAFFVGLLGVLSALNDRSLSLALLSPLGPDRLHDRAAPAFAELVERHGHAWAKELFSAWEKRPRWNAPPWLPHLPALCEALLAGAPKSGRALAAWLLDRQVASFEQRHRALLDLPPRAAGRGLSDHSRDDLLPLLESAAVLGAAAARDDLLAFLTTGKTALPAVTAAELLQSWRKVREPAAMSSLGLDALHRYAAEGLRRALAAPTRRRDDWSIEPSLRCKCALCKELTAFLRAPDRIEHAWPLPEDQRRHIHQTIDAHGLPVSHATTRRGRPYTLVLRKQDALFEREKELRSHEKKLSAWLARAEKPGRSTGP